MRSILERAQKIRLLICDVDGVFTDGSLYIGNQGEEFKAFHIQDGLGVKLLLHSGIDVGVITARTSAIVQTRMSDLGIQYIFQGQHEKLPAYEQLLKQLDLTPEQVAYVGDDLPDLPLIRRSGLGIAVANAVSLVKQYAHWQTKIPGGLGAIREISEFILQAQGKFSSAVEKYVAI